MVPAPHSLKLCSTFSLLQLGAPALSKLGTRRLALRLGRHAGSVLVPVDTAGRLLEVLLVLGGHWDTGAVKQPLVLLTHVALTVLELARSQLEWLAEGLSKGLASSSAGNPYACRCVLAQCGHWDEAGCTIPWQASEWAVSCCPA